MIFHKKPLAVMIGQVFGTAALFTVSGLAQAQQAPTERITVTGSNISRVQAETPSPVQVITAEEMQKSGFSTVQEVLNSITANGNGMLDQSFNRAFAAGASGVSLRGLTLGGTLVLIDGRRMAPYPRLDDGQREFVDLSSIPFDAIERIEVLKDGASAVYGSDAVAGVVNVILKKRAEGTTITAELGDTEHGGGQMGRASIIHGFGKPTDTVYGVVTGEYRKKDEIKVKDRSGNWTKMNWAPEGGYDLRPGAQAATGGTATDPVILNAPYLTRPGRTSTNPADYAFLTTNCDHARMRAGACVYKDVTSEIQPESERYSLVASMTAKLSENWQLNLTGSLFNSQNGQVGQYQAVVFNGSGGFVTYGPNQNPGSGGVFAPNTYMVPATYPGNTLGVPGNIRAILADIGPLRTETDTDTYRFVAELNGKLGAWDVNVAAGYSKVETELTYKGYISRPGLLAALTDPVNPYLLAGGNTAANIARVSPDERVNTKSELTFFEARGSRDLMALPGGPLSMAMGAGYVDKELNSPNARSRQLGTQTIGGAYVIGDEQIYNAYVELVAPVTKELELDLAVRYDHYDSVGGTTNPKGGFKWIPMKELAFRGTASTGFRAPTAAEIGNAGSAFAAGAYQDPILCATGDPTHPTTVQGQCAVQVAHMQVTTPDLDPEQSKAFTFGVLVEPIKGWTTSLDYYKIKVDDQIIPDAIGASVDVRGAPTTVTFGDGSQGISPVGLILYQGSGYKNTKTETDGLELETRYKFDLASNGSLTVGLMWTHVLSFDVTVDGKTYKLEGTHGPSLIGGNTGSPEDRALLTLEWNKGPWTVATQTNYVGSYNVLDPSNIGIYGSPADTCTDAVANAAGHASFATGIAVPRKYCNIDSFTYTNLNVRYKYDKALTVFGSITNLFDQEPPVDIGTYGATGQNTNSFGTGLPYNPSLHNVGAIGRSFSLGMSYKF